jgi:hypothetical protein
VPVIVYSGLAVLGKAQNAEKHSKVTCAHKSGTKFFAPANSTPREDGPPSYSVVIGWHAGLINDYKRISIHWVT